MQVFIQAFIHHVLLFLEDQTFLFPIEKKLFKTSKEAVVPPRRAQTNPAPTFIVLSKEAL